MIDAALILAAGKNTRFDTGVPKSLHRVGYETLLERHIREFHKVGIRKIAVVTGFRGEMISDFISEFNHVPDSPVDIIHNPDFEKANGLSIKVARKWIESRGVTNFMCTMSDHIFSSGFYKSVIKSANMNHPLDVPLRLAVDQPGQHNTYIDLEDVTRVVCSRDEHGLLYINQVGKLIVQYNYFDTGLFILNRNVFDHLDYCASVGKNSISDLVNLLATQHQAIAVDVTGLYWNDVDTPADFETVKKQLHFL